MGGDISLVSEFGKGSRFSLSLMLFRLIYIYREFVDEDKQVVGYEGEFKMLLIVDDEVSQWQLLSDIFIFFGFIVIIVSFVKEGLDKLKCYVIDFMFFDLKMFEISGWKVVELVR